MRTSYVCFKIETGEITCTGSASNEENCYIQMQDPLAEDVLLNVEANDATQYVSNGQIVNRPVFDIPEEVILELGSTESFNIPAGTSVFFNGDVDVLTEAQLELEGQFAASYTLRLELFPYQSKTVNVEVR